MTEDRTRIEALRKRLETGRERKSTRKSMVDIARREKLTVYLTPETREKIEQLYAEVYYQTRAKKVSFLEEVIKAGLEEKEKVLSSLREK